tara:strand:+ start:350 stop:592 length:243 start_codon:yes stop_codon:yes gene_type:complete
MDNFNEEDKDVWTSADGDIEISEMATSHIINTLHMINEMINKGNLEDYPIQYDTLFRELENRGFGVDDIDDEFSEIYKSL